MTHYRVTVYYLTITLEREENSLLYALFKKDFQHYKWPIMITVAISAILFFAIFKIITNENVSIEKGASFGLLPLSFLILFTLFLIATVLFIQSFNRDTRQKDIWLHTPATITQLVLPKITANSLFFLCVILLPTVVINYALFHIVSLTISESITMTIICLALLTLIFMSSLPFFLMAYICYLFILRYMNKFLSLVFTLIIFLFFIYLYSSFFAGLTEFWDIQPWLIKHSTLLQKLNTSSNDVIAFGTHMYMGSLIESIVVPVVLFIIGTRCLERVLAR